MVNWLTVVTVMVVAMWVCAQLGNTFTSEESIQKHVETSTGGEAKEGSEEAGSKGGEGGEAAAAGDNKAATAATKCGTCYGAGDEGQVGSQWTASGREVTRASMLMVVRVLLLVGGGVGPSVLQHLCRGEGGLQEEGMGLHGVERRAGKGQKQQIAVPCQADGAAARAAGTHVCLAMLSVCLSVQCKGEQGSPRGMLADNGEEGCNMHGTLILTQVRRRGVAIGAAGRTD